MMRRDAHLLTARPAAMPSQGCRRSAARGPRLPRWLRQPRHGGGACWRRNTLGSVPRPKKSWVALLGHPEPPHHAVERRPVDPEEACGFGAVPRGARDRAPDARRRGAVEGLLQRPVAGRGRRDALLEQEVLRTDRVAARKNDRALDGVLEL